MDSVKAELTKARANLSQFVFVLLILLLILYTP